MAEPCLYRSHGRSSRRALLRSPTGRRHRGDGGGLPGRNREGADAVLGHLCRDGADRLSRIETSTSTRAGTRIGDCSSPSTRRSPTRCPVGGTARSAESSRSVAVVSRRLRNRNRVGGRRGLRRVGASQRGRRAGRRPRRAYPAARPGPDGGRLRPRRRHRPERPPRCRSARHRVRGRDRPRCHRPAGHATGRAQRRDGSCGGQHGAAARHGPRPRGGADSRPDIRRGRRRAGAGAHRRRCRRGHRAQWNVSALHEAIRSVQPGGRVIAAGFYQGAATGLDLGEEFHHNRVSVVASQIGVYRPR